MKTSIALTLLAIVAVECGSDGFYFPEEWEKINQRINENRRLANGQMGPADFQGSVQQANDLDYQSIGAFQQGRPFVLAAQALRPAAALPTKISSTPFGNFLPPQWRDHVLGIISRGITKFTLDIDRVIESSSAVTSDNLVFSPASLTVTLAMVLLASGGKTFDEVARILGLESGVDISHHSEIVHQIIGILVREGELRQASDPNLPQNKFAFGIFVEDGFPIREQFRAVSEKVYRGDIINVDFSNHSADAQRIINKWVNDKTMGKIQSMLAEAPSPTTDVIITSAMYFSGEWANHFMPEGTKRKLFQVDENESIYVDLMTNGGEFFFYEDTTLGAKIIKFNYKGNEVSMYAVLPTKPGTAALKELKSRLTPEIIDGLIDNMVNSSCIIVFPKMKLSSTLKLQSALEALGLKSLFDPQTADLSVLSPGRGSPENLEPQTVQQAFEQSTVRPSIKYNLEGGYSIEQWTAGYKMHKIPSRSKRQTSRPIDQAFIDFLNMRKLPTFGVDELRNTAGLKNPGLFANDVIHKVEMTVNEKGTEAAAATSVILDRTGTFKRFTANRPFLFFIRHDPSKVIWFWSTINRPTPYYDSP